MTTLLENLELEELSLVDVPANQSAMVSLFKRGNPDEKEKQVKTEDIQKEEGQVETEVVADEVETLKSANADLIARLENLTKALDEAGYDVDGEAINKRAPIEYIEVDGEKIIKSSIPATILKKLEEAEVAKADAELTKLAQEKLPSFNLDVAKQLVKQFSQEEKIMEALKAADAAFDAKMEELGEATAPEANTAIEKFDGLVAKAMADKGVSKEEAKAIVTESAEGVALLKQAREEK